MLKETPRSLRLYFGIVAVFSLLPIVAVITQGRGSLLVLAITLVSAIFGALFAYIAIRFAELLRKNPKFITNVLIGNFALSIVGFGLSLMGGLQPASLVRLLIAALIYFYLVKSVIRLSAEATQENA